VVPDQAGGIRRICDLVDEHGEAIEADLTEFYNLDIADVWRGLLSPRRALVLVGQLGSIPGSRFRGASLGGPEFVGWSRDVGMLADIFDALVDNSVVTVKAAGGKTGRPDTYPRPVAAKDKAQSVDVPSIDDFPIHMVAGLTKKK
jgi:hypothetical protein